MAANQFQQINGNKSISANQFQQINFSKLISANQFKQIHGKAIPAKKNKKKTSCPIYFNEKFRITTISTIFQLHAMII